MRARLKHAAAQLGWPALVVALAIAWQYRAPLLGRVWLFEDIANYFVPLYAAAARSMRAGSFPTWDLGAWSGQPLVGDPQLGLFYPPNWLWMIVRPVTLYAWLTLAHALIGAAGMLAWARARGRSPAAAALAGLTLALGAFFVLEVRHAMFTATTAWVPWLGWAIERFAQERRRDHFLWIAVTGGLALLAGGWSMLPYGGAVIGVLAVSVILRSHNFNVQVHNNDVAKPISRRRLTRSQLHLALLFALAGLFALALAAVALLPTLAHAKLSPRALGVTYAIASSYSWPSWRYALTLIAPTLYGDDARGTYVGAPDQWEICGYGIGAVATVLMLASLLWRERRGERVALMLVLLAACDVARGGGGLLHPLLYRLPLMASLRCPARALYVWTIAAPILAADGGDALLTRVRHEPWRARLGLLLLVTVAAELLFTWRSENPSLTKAVAEDRPTAMAWLRVSARPGRATNDVHLPQPFHNMGLRFGFESAGGYHSLPIWRYLNLLWIANHGAPYPHAQLADDLTAQGLWRFSSPIVDLLGVQWVATAHDRPIDAPGFSLAFAGDEGIDVYRNAAALPRTFVVYRATVVADEAAAARAVAAPDFDPARSVVVETPLAGIPASSPRTDPLPTLVRELIRLGPQVLEIEVETEQPGVLVIAEPWYPGWRVTVDGQEATLLRADYALRGVALPPGVHRVALELTCPPLRKGAAITLVALLVALVLSSRVGRRRAGA